MRTHLLHLLTLQLALLLLPCCHSRQLKGTQEQPIIHGQSALTFYGWLGPPLGSRLPECAGDCDSSDDCQPGLACFGSSREEELNADKIPGCSGFRYVNTDGIKSDYCYDPSKVVANRADLPTDSDTLLFVGKDVGFELGECQGDCRVDRDCRGDLRCYEDKGGAVPGCLGKREKGIDYCYDPNWKEDDAKEIDHEEKPLGITDGPVPMESNESSNDGFIPETPQPAPNPTGRETPAPSKNPTKYPTKPPSPRPTLLQEPRETTEPTTEHPTVIEEGTVPIPTMDKGPSPSPTKSTEAPAITVELSPFTLILDFYTPRRHVRRLIIEENVDEDEELLNIVSGLIGRLLLKTYPDTYSDLVMDAEFIDEVEIDSVTSAAYRFTGEATFKDAREFSAPTNNEMNALVQEALNEDNLLRELRESNHIILELTAGTTMLVNDDNNGSVANEEARPPKGEISTEERLEQPPNNSDEMRHSLRITAIVLCSILGASTVVLLVGYLYVRRKEKQEQEMYKYELESSDSRGELEGVTPKRSILHPFSSPIKQKATFDTQEESPSHSPQWKQYLQDFGDAELPDLSLPDLDDGYSIDVDWCDFSYARSEHNRTLYNMPNSLQDPLSKRFNETNFSSSTSGAGASIAENTHASSTVATASVITGTLTAGPLQSRSRRRQSTGAHDDSDYNSSSDGDLCELGSIHLSSVLKIDATTVASNGTSNNFDMVWRSARITNGQGSDDELGGHAGELGGSSDDSIIELKIDEDPSDDDEEGWNESRLRKFSFVGES